MNICITFQEEYKRLDQLCRDCLNSKDGVSEYIRQMEDKKYSGSYLVLSWDNDYRCLKHVRWVRNRLAHEVGSLEAGLCTEEDVKFIVDFRERILSAEDPLAVLRKHQKEEEQRKREKGVLFSGKIKEGISEGGRLLIEGGRRLVESIKKIFNK